MLSDAPGEWALVEQSARIMATPIGVHVAAPAGEEARAHGAIDACMAWMREVDERLSRFAPESELSRLNAAAGTWRSVSATLFEVVAQSVAAAEASAGLFDPALLPVLEALGYDRDFKQIAYQEAPGSANAPVANAAGSWRGIELDRARRRIRLPAGTRLDLGGIAKGWAADVALDRCFADIANVLIDVGGDVRARGGARAGELWAIGIGDGRDRPETPADEERLSAVVTLGRGGLATSGATWRWWYRAGERQHHLIDPRTGRPARVWIDAADGDPAAAPLIASASALAPTAAHAEVAAKVALLRGYPQALGLVDAAWQAARVYDEHNTVDAYGDASVALILVLGNGAVACSANLRDYLATLGGGGDVWVN
jgi:thiamine biosynthesis lipoprotein